jgi:hypothetical protein
MQSNSTYCIQSCRDTYWANSNLTYVMLHVNISQLVFLHLHQQVNHFSI